MAPRVKPDFILLNNQLPIMDGYTVAREMRKNEGQEYQILGGEFWSKIGADIFPKQPTGIKTREKVSMDRITGSTGYDFSGQS